VTINLGLEDKNFATIKLVVLGYLQILLMPVSYQTRGATRFSSGIKEGDYLGISSCSK
jgi:hypothetical protein